MKKVICLQGAINVHKKDLEELCRKYNHEVDYVDFDTPQEFIDYANKNEIDVILSTWPGGRKLGGYSDELITALGKTGVRAVCHCGAGYDVLGNVRLWKKMGTQVANCPNAPAAETADCAMFLLLGAIRNFTRYITALKQGHWKNVNARTDAAAPPGRSPSALTLGILGMGSIGGQIRDRALPFGFKKIQYHKRSRLSPEEEKGAEYISDLDTFLSTSDVIVVVVPHNSSTHHLLNRERLMHVVREHAVIVNVARGAIIDEAALVEALESGRVSSVGLDVFEFEPKVEPGLIENENALLTPHLGTHTHEAWDKFECELIDNVRSLFETGHVISLVQEQRPWEQ